ncbi:hypothetical protein EHR01_07665 [Leptospira mtsangambouensis]|uniref:TonB C-terminal domain-containing protein n=1 Tax=Leptospira mtsangambouensis TaxID=2484912 RepID=A0ABY2P1M1_9LEPT|nr:hypothetical protein EHR01_07665 [Leptospira mtsangambouensis]
MNEKGIFKKAQIILGKNPLFGEKALEIVKKIRFKPALKNGIPVKSSHRIPNHFSFD